MEDKYLELVKLLCMLSILSEISKETTPIEEFKELSIKNILN